MQHQIWILLLTLLAHSNADTPANCSYEDIQRYWIFQESDQIESRGVSCTEFPTRTNDVYIKLHFPNVATDNWGNIGTWTLIYNQGFEVIINYRKYFAFSLYEQVGEKVISYCHQTFPGWSHDLLGHNWACIKGQKVPNWELKYGEHHAFTNQSKMHVMKPLMLERVDVSQFVSGNFVSEFNAKQSSWTARVYLHLQKKSSAELVRMAGGPASRLAQ